MGCAEIYGHAGKAPTSKCTHTHTTHIHTRHTTHGIIDVHTCTHRCTHMHTPQTTHVHTTHVTQHIESYTYTHAHPKDHTCTYHTHITQHRESYTFTDIHTPQPHTCTQPSKWLPDGEFFKKNHAFPHISSPVSPVPQPSWHQSCWQMTGGLLAPHGPAMTHPGAVGAALPIKGEESHPEAAESEWPGREGWGVNRPL